MRWTLPDDLTPPVITAEGHIGSGHGNSDAVRLPGTCVIFEMGMAIPYIKERYDAIVLMEKLPCFIADSECIALRGNPRVCFVRGGYGAPAAVDTLETVRAMGVRRVIVAGMCGGFSAPIRVCEVVIPRRVLCEEGTSHHYFEEIEYAAPDSHLFQAAVNCFEGGFTVRTEDTVTSDSFYRQTYAKEAYWRGRGCVGVDMESSALLSVSTSYSIPAVSILLCSDKHPLGESEAKWDWGNADFKATRQAFVDRVVAFAGSLSD